MRGFHENWFWVAVVSNGMVGVWGLFLAWRKTGVNLAFAIARGTAIAAMLVQVGAGFLLFNQGFRPPSIHMFYGFLILFSYTFAYIYRAQMDKRPALSYGLLLLFVMGLGLRAFSNVG